MPVEISLAKIHDTKENNPKTKILASPSQIAMLTLFILTWFPSHG
jgi:hypothetical protein